MGYRVKVYQDKTGNQCWKVLFEEYKGASRKARGVPKGTDGFHPLMTVAQAKARMRQLNAEVDVKRLTSQRLAASVRVSETAKVAAAYLGEMDVAAFERKTFGRRFVHPDDKGVFYWRTCQKCLMELRLAPEFWEDERGKFYDWFRTKAYSLATIQKLLRYLNLWGRHVSKARREYFQPIPAPMGIERKRLMEAWARRKSKRGNKKSAPLTPALLQAKSAQLTAGEHAWLTVSLAFGLRPEETDQTKSGNEELVAFSEHDDVPVLAIYQTKVKQWKFIPAKYPEQVVALALIPVIEKPSHRRIRAVFGVKYGRYMGRHGFPKWMKVKGEDLSDVSLWMGHADISTTQAHYVDKLEVAMGKKAA